MSSVYCQNNLKVRLVRKNPKNGFDEFASGFALIRNTLLLSLATMIFFPPTLSFAQQGTGVAPPGRSQPRPNGGAQTPPQQGEAKRMELEERRRLRQEIQRHGPDFRSKEGAAVRSVPNTIVAPAVMPPSPLPVTPQQPAPLPPPPSYFGWPALPTSNPTATTPSVSNSGISRGPALSQEERQQLRQQIREERKRGLYPTPTEVDR